MVDLLALLDDNTFAGELLLRDGHIDAGDLFAVHGNAALLDGLIDRIEAELGQPVTVVATGGLAPLVVPFCRKKITVDDALLLKGMLILYRKNQEEPRRR